jgi:2-iminobutanoate/2-iminopropanoate deaminase
VADNVAHTAVVPPGASKPIGRYSPAVRVPFGPDHWMVFVSGQVASDSEGRLVGGDDPGRQAEAVFNRLQAVLRASGGDLCHLVSVTIFLRDLAHFHAVSAVRNRLLGEVPPASTLVEVSGLAEPGRLVEINGIAVVPRDGA